MRKRIHVYLLILIMVLVVAVPAFAAENPTSITGLKTRISQKVSSTAVIKDRITIAPVRDCIVKLQYFDTDTSKWKTASTYEVNAESDGIVTLKYSSKWKNYRKSKWRVAIPAVDDYPKYISETITVSSTRPSGSKLKLGCKGAVIIRASDAFVVYGKNKDMRLANASTTKMMTALLTLEKGGLNETTKISKKAANTGYGCLYATAGTTFRIKDLLNVMLVHSSNDAAATLAEWNAGTVSRFAKKMTKRAKDLGCLNTNFMNPHGLSEKEHYSSAYDLALIQRECIKYPGYLEILKKKYYSFSTVGKPKRYYTFYTTDRLLGSDTGFLGGKTGYTRAARQCFCGIYKYNGVTYLYSVLGNPTSNGRWQDCRNIMTFIKNNYK